LKRNDKSFFNKGLGIKEKKEMLKDQSSLQMDFLKVENTNTIKAGDSAMNLSIRSSANVKNKLYQGEKLKLESFFNPQGVLTRHKALENSILHRDHSSRGNLKKKNSKRKQSGKNMNTKDEKREDGGDTGGETEKKRKKLMIIIS
jgi:hypothetical protein